MAAGRPTICLDLGGPAVQVTEQTGFKIAALAPQQAIEDMAQAMLRLARDPELRRAMGEAGRARVARDYDWDAKGDWLNRVYKGVLASSDSPPLPAHPAPPGTPENT